MPHRGTGRLKLVHREETGGAVLQPDWKTTSFDTGTGTPMVGQPAAPLETQATPKPAQVMTLQNLANGLSLVFPLYVSVERSGDEWLATSTDLALVGRGDSDLESVDDLRAQVTELYESLIEMRDSLGPLLVQQLAFLDRLSGRDT